MNGPGPVPAPMMDLDEAARATDGLPLGVRAAFSGVSTDSRAIAPGELFVALVGERFDGHDYVRQAMERGAAAATTSSRRMATSTTTSACR